MSDEDKGDICEPCQGSGYIKVYMGRGTVELTQDGKTHTMRGQFRFDRKCVPCKGSGRIKREEKV